ncbi:PAS domain S-box protein [Hymenobacter aquaticus]|uniref:histidine kinase n=1 Tax=Hymenobacter aquaticus TaxID=1867101 RepID=A0A4Z0Q3Z3_9BACT|nr:PAS domain-containing protein [Hymenobacter aquaticus]TGE24206.1 PAS domain S-box protein [Hymenobacter aquaticus]
MLSPPDYQALFEALPDLHLALTPELIIVAASAGAARVAGRPLAALLGQAAPAALAGSALDVLPEALARVRARGAADEATSGGWYHRAWPVLGAAGEIRYFLYRAEAVRPAATPAVQTLLDTLPVVVWLSGPAGLAGSQCRGWLAYTGYGADQARDLGWLTAVHPDDQARARQCWTQALAEGREYALEYRLRRHDGAYRWQLVREVPTHDAAGHLVSWTGTMLDIQEQKEAQQRLADQDRHLQQILSQVPAHIATLLGPDHVYGFLNEKGNQLFGGNVRLGTPAALAVPALVTNGYIKLVDEVYRTGEPFRLSEMPLTQPPAPDGSVATLYFDGVFQPLTDEQGQTQGILVFGIDVTERVLAKQRTAELMEEIREQDAQFRTMVESVPLFVYITDAAGRMLYINPQRYAFTGQAPDPAFRHWQEALHPDDWRQLRADFIRGRKLGQAWSGEYRLRRHDGEYCWQLLRIVPLRRPDGTVTRWYGSSIDIDEQKRRQHQQRREDQRLRQILGQAPAILATVEGPDHRYAFFNDSHQQLLANRAELGQPLAALAPELVEQGFVARLDHVYQTGETFVGHEVPLQPLGQPECFLDLTLQALRDEQGAVAGVLTFAVDSTERVRARRSAGALAAEVSRRDMRLRRMTEALPAVSFICAADGTLEYLSPQWYHYTGQKSELTGRDIFTALVHPDDQPALRQALREVFSQGRPWDFEYRLRRHDGQYRWQLSRGVAEFDAEGQALRWYGTMVDNHEQKELQNELRRSEEKFRFMADSTPAIIWTGTPEGAIDYCNRPFLDYTGLRPADSMGPGWLQAVHPDDVATTAAHWQRSVSTGHEYEVQHRLRRHDGHYHWQLVRALPLRDAEGRILKWYGSSIDVQNQREMQQQLQARNEQLARTNTDLDNFVYTASHDLRQPIDNMAGIFEELTRTAYFRDPEAIKLITMFERALQQIHQTIHDLSDVVQLQRRHALVPAEAVALEPLTREVIGSMQEQGNEVGARFELDFRAVPTVHFVRANLQSILYNLLSNSLKYAAPGRPPRVRIFTSLLDGVPVLTVADNGQGIDLERHGTELFQLFRRFHEDVEGSGMGLYLVNRMVQLNGAWLEVDSTVGVGSTFRIFFRSYENVPDK